jgi:hypothetical protein
VKGDRTMKILHIMKKDPDASTKKIIEVQASGNQSKIIDLTQGGIAYDKLVTDVFTSDKVFCW